MIDTLSLLADNSLDKFDSRYRMVLVAAQRAKHIMQGAERSQTSKFTKETSLALEEVMHGKVPYLMGKDAREAFRVARKSGAPEFDQSLLGEGDENTAEIHKQLSVYIDDTPKEPAPPAEE